MIDILRQNFNNYLIPFNDRSAIAIGKINQENGKRERKNDKNVIREKWGK